MRYLADIHDDQSKDLPLDERLKYLEDTSEAVIGNYFVFSDGSEIEVPVK